MDKDLKLQLGIDKRWITYIFFFFFWNEYLTDIVDQPMLPQVQIKVQSTQPIWKLRTKYSW